MLGDLLLLFGAFIMFSGALGLNLLSDSFQRFHVAGKVSLFGLALLILGDSLIYKRMTGHDSLAYLGIIVILLVGPFSAHILARSLYQKNQGQSDKDGEVH